VGDSGAFLWAIPACLPSSRPQHLSYCRPTLFYAT